MTTHFDQGSNSDFPSAGGLKRRTVLEGAAWTLPAIAIATAAPARAASGDLLTLAFDRATYTTVTCGTITGAKVTATINGQPAVGSSVTVTLPAGYSFSGGSTSYTGITGTDGSIALPTITAPAMAGSGTASAVSGTTTATASIVATQASATAYRGEPSATPGAYTSVPADAKAVGDVTWLTPGGDLYFGNTRIATGVTSAFEENIAGRSYVSYIANGKAYRGEPSATPGNYTNVPADAKTVGDVTWLTPGGDLYFGNTRIATGVTSAFEENIAGRSYVSYIANGKAYRGEPSATPGNYTNVPADAKTVGDVTWLTPGGDLYFGNTRIATGVTSATEENLNGVTYISYVANGTAYRGQPGATPAAYTNVPANAKTVGDVTWLTPGGDLYFGNTRIATGVTSAFEENLSGRSYVSYIKASSC